MGSLTQYALPSSHQDVRFAPPPVKEGAIADVNAADGELPEAIRPRSRFHNGKWYFKHPLLAHTEQFLEK